MRTLQTMKCNACGSPLPMDEADPYGSGLLKCAYCGTATDVHSLPGARRRLKVPLPTGMTCETQGHDLIITRRLLGMDSWIFLAVALMVNSIIFSDWDRMMARHGSGGVMPLFLGSIVIVVNYIALSLFINRAVVRLSPDCLSITHQPLPLPGGGEWTPVQVAQLYCTERIRYHKNGATVDYQVRAVFRDGSSRTLVSKLPEKAIAVFIEQKIEEALEIRDIPVGGEVIR
ncbi:MAG: hypothetical protein JNJ83_03740 [Verrucomicrobiaceae bacterium]|nr:hypothetical protein [Verrucomicrobiaceae bacterium]